MLPCDSNPCQNSATCLNSNSNEFYSCGCLPGYEGQYLLPSLAFLCSSHFKTPSLQGTTVKSILTSAHRLHAGSEAPVTITSMVTRAPVLLDTLVNWLFTYISEFTVQYSCCLILGTLCDTNVDECLSYPCENFATCIDGANSYTCDCVGGYTGTIII